MELTGIQGIIGESPAIRTLRQQILRIAPTDLTVLISGETGSGKELVAQALHVHGQRRGRFVPVNVCAVADTMFEAAFFGHVRGAFTGATAESPGYMAEAGTGSLFLDEISGLGIAQQDKLLRALQTRSFRPVGAARDHFSEFRLITATNRELETLIRVGDFRMDLYYRLRCVVINVPPLRDRSEDVALLARHFASMVGGTDGALEVSNRALDVLVGHEWPGNVRELHQVVRSAALWTKSRIIGRDDIIAALGPVIRHPGMDGMMNQAERRGLLEVLERCGWNTIDAAVHYGVDRGTVYRWMRRLNIPRPRGTRLGRRVALVGDGEGVI